VSELGVLRKSIRAVLLSQVWVAWTCSWKVSLPIAWVHWTCLGCACYVDI